MTSPNVPISPFRRLASRLLRAASFCVAVLAIANCSSPEEGEACDATDTSNPCLSDNIFASLKHCQACYESNGFSKTAGYCTENGGPDLAVCESLHGKGGGSKTGGGSGDCASSCSSEQSDVQLDSFCRQACCLTVTGQAANAAKTCQAGAELGTSSCRYCN